MDTAVLSPGVGAPAMPGAAIAPALPPSGQPQAAPDTGNQGNSFALPVEPPGPGEVLTVYQNGKAVQVVQGQMTGTAQQQYQNAPIAQATVQPLPGQPVNPNGGDPSQQQAGQETQPAATPQPVFSNQDLSAYVSADGQNLEFYSNHTGKLYTRVANKPEAIASVMANQLSYVNQMRTQPMPVAEAPVQAAPVVDPREGLRAKMLPKAKEIAAKKFGDQYNVDPIAETVAELVSDALFDHQQEQQALTETQRVQQAENAEFVQVYNADPTFRPDNPLVAELRKQNPTANPRKLHALYVYNLNEYLATQGQPPHTYGRIGQAAAPVNGSSSPSPVPTAAPPINQPAPNQNGTPLLFARPGGSTPGAAADPLMSNQEVQDSINIYNRKYGSAATEEGRQQVANLAIQGIRNRGQLWATRQ